jgi:hypothetical protein
LFLNLLKPEIQQYLRNNVNSNVTKLALQKNPFPEVEWTDLLNQIAAHQKAKDKLPTWFNADGIVYPSKVSVEQTSSEATANYKSGLVSGNSLIDLTGGFGIDDFYFAKQITNVTHCEMNIELSAIAKHNFSVLDAINIKCKAGDSLDVLTVASDQWDWMYIDPARRSDSKGKVFMLTDCLPNVPDLLSTYFKYTSNILIKTAPLLDITAGLNELHFVKEIHIVALNNEVKELLWILQRGYTGSIALIAANITKSKTETFTSVYNNNAEASYSAPDKYLYEPNSAIMKSGSFDAISASYNINKLHKNTQLYTSNALIEFPGRRFVINNVVPYQKSEMKQATEGKKMNVTVRNFPLAVSEIQKKWKIKDGGDTYAFFTTNIHDEKIVLICSKV